MNYIYQIGICFLTYSNLNKIGSDECCSSLTITSTGWANDVRTSNWGDYKYYGPHNGRNAYKHDINDRFLYWSPLNTWMVSLM